MKCAVKILLAAGVAPLASASLLAVVRPRGASGEAAELADRDPFLWDRSFAPSAPLSGAQVSQSVAHLLGAQPVSLQAARDLPNRDLVTPPRAVLLLAVGGAEGGAESKMGGSLGPRTATLLERRTAAPLADEDGLFSGALERLSSGLGLLGLEPRKTTCVSNLPVVLKASLCASGQRKAALAVAESPPPEASMKAAPVRFEAAARAVQAHGIRVAATAGGWEVTLPGALDKPPVKLCKHKDAGFLEAMALLASLANPSALPAGTKPQNTGVPSDGVPDLWVVGVDLPANSEGDEEKRAAADALVDAALSDALEGLSKLYRGRVAAPLLLLSHPLDGRSLDGRSLDKEEGRRQLAKGSLAPTPAPGDKSSDSSDSGSQGGLAGKKPYTVQEIASYQICLWTAVVLVLVLLSAICCMVNMDIQPDSLLYAKFQADTSSKLD
mmetsp:Transcript_45625/g.103016  ORF Transcript_45625/g.103016 Transcript_45625/m.103016 type:complete len:440 (+) Transcript_45625:124-1443(+)|eukprot:CAMPEP_0172616124 /NCGR_PEP_ID=MMETSP1068-20121228/62719_1 /TAXON_ID=35684 /ORGANISM="Pseudopedinella elastica, Strain CCMP716" /LENGTH=439 /DNA_ID=CAMNT_0013421459 /DNA_START=47 /DNA_END=1366 /DNA_ORIENTATION=-